ncbi:hypothetical protein [Thermomonospora umbrina]|nr:hypothetical protein [Thermomonospora umbrina]
MTPFRAPVLVASAALLLTALTLTACNGGVNDIREGVKDGAEIGKRQGQIEVLGAAEIQLRAGVVLNGELSCEVTSTGGQSTPVTCTGTTDEGRAVSLKGTITSAAPIAESDWLRGDFVATVGGEEVFRTPCIGTC